MKITRPFTKLLTLAAILPLCAQANTVILDQDFNNGSRSIQDLPSSAQWFQSFNNLDMVETSPGEYSLENAPSSATIRHGVAYYAPTSTPISIAAGQTITASLSITPSSKTPDNSDRILRIGLLHSGANRLTEDGNPNIAMSGYGFFVNPETLRVNTYGRTEDAGPVFSSLTNGNGWTGGTTGGQISDITPEDAFAMVQNTAYDITLSIEHLSNGDLNISYTTSNGVDSVTTSFVESNYLVTDFDTIAFAWGNHFGDGLIDNVAITVVPEPSQFALLAGFAGFIALGIKRQRKNA